MFCGLPRPRGALIGCSIPCYLLHFPRASYVNWALVILNGACTNRIPWVAYMGVDRMLPRINRVCEKYLTIHVIFIRKAKGFFCGLSLLTSISFATDDYV